MSDGTPGAIAAPLASRVLKWPLYAFLGSTFYGDVRDRVSHEEYRHSPITIHQNPLIEIYPDVPLAPPENATGGTCPPPPTENYVEDTLTNCSINMKAATDRLFHDVWFTNIPAENIVTKFLRDSAIQENVTQNAIYWSGYNVTLQEAQQSPLFQGMTIQAFEHNNLVIGTPLKRAIGSLRFLGLDAREHFRLSHQSVSEILRSTNHIPQLEEHLLIIMGGFKKKLIAQQVAEREMKETNAKLLTIGRGRSFIINHPANDLLKEIIARGFGKPFAERIELVGHDMRRYIPLFEAHVRLAKLFTYQNMLISATYVVCVYGNMFSAQVREHRACIGIFDEFDEEEDLYSDILRDLRHSSSQSNQRFISQLLERLKTNEEIIGSMINQMKENFFQIDDHINAQFIREQENTGFANEVLTSSSAVVLYAAALSGWHSWGPIFNVGFAQVVAHGVKLAINARVLQSGRPSTFLNDLRYILNEFRDDSRTDGYFNVSYASLRLTSVIGLMTVCYIYTKEEKPKQPTIVQLSPETKEKLKAIENETEAKQIEKKKETKEKQNKFPFIGAGVVIAIVLLTPSLAHKIKNHRKQGKKKN